MLVLPIKKKWFDMIANGEKKEEYREIKPYYTSRFFRNFIKSGMEIKYLLAEENMNIVYDFIILRNGYRKDSPQLKCYVRIRKGYGKEEWRSRTR